MSSEFLLDCHPSVVQGCTSCTPSYCVYVYILEAILILGTIIAFTIPVLLVIGKKKEVDKE